MIIGGAPPRLGAASNLVTSTSSAAPQRSAARLSNSELRDGLRSLQDRDGVVTATATDTLLPAAIPQYVIVTPGQKLAAIGTGAGIVNVTECVGRTSNSPSLMICRRLRR